MTSSQTSPISKVIESVQKMHGEGRGLQSKHESYTTWLLRQRSAGLGVDTIIKEEVK
jgi:hypothetical protein